MKCGRVARGVMAMGTALTLVFACGVTANAEVLQTKRGIQLDGGNVTGIVGGIEDQSWGFVDDTIRHYVYAAQDGVSTGKVWANAGQTASTISYVGTWDMSDDDALGGPLKNGSCSPSYHGARCGCPLYKNYPTVDEPTKTCGR